MTAGDRFKGWIESLADSWKDRLAGWMANWLDRGIYNYLVHREPEIIDASRETIAKILAQPNVPPELRNLLEKSQKTGDILTVITGWLMSILGSVFAVMSLGGPLGKIWEYTQERVQMSYRLDPLQAITAWRRDQEKYANVFEDLKDQGWSDYRIDLLKFVTQFYPNPADLVRWQAREVFEPAMVSKYGLDDELGGITRDPFYKAGMTDEQITNYWRAHWEHASWMQMVEMLHRQLVTEEDVWEWFRLVEITPYWRDKLIKSAYNVPTRVDVRRFYDLRTIDEKRLREIYTAQGYHGKDLDDYVLLTKVYVGLPDLLARWKNGWITLDDVREGLKALGMDDDAADELIQTKVKSTEPVSTTEGKELTKTEIYKGVKTGIISEGEAIDLLMDLDYTEDQAQYLLTTNVQVLTGSPENYIDFKDMTQKYRKAAGRESQPIPDALKRAAAEVVRLTKDVESLKALVEEEKRTLVDVEPLPPEATAKLKELQVSLHRAEAALFKAQTDYNALKAQWRYKT